MIVIMMTMMMVMMMILLMMMIMITQHRIYSKYNNRSPSHLNPMEINIIVVNILSHVDAYLTHVTNNFNGNVMHITANRITNQWCSTWA